jgi:hypothetical protein
MCFGYAVNRTAPHIEFSGDSLQVKWIHARSIPAKMVDLKPSWNWSDKLFIDKTVSLQVFPVIAESSVARWMAIGRPDPAAGRIVSYFSKKPFSRAHFGLSWIFL